MYSTASDFNSTYTLRLHYPLWIVITHETDILIQSYFIDSFVINITEINISLLHIKFEA